MKNDKLIDQNKERAKDNRITLLGYGPTSPTEKNNRLVYCPNADRITVNVALRTERIERKIERSGEREKEKKRRQLSPSRLPPVAGASDANQSALWSRDIITPNAYLLHDKYVTGTQCLPSPSVLACQPILSCLHVSRGNETRCTWNASMSLTEGCATEH